MTHKPALSAVLAEAAETQTIEQAEVPWVVTAVEEEYQAIRQQRGLIDLSGLGCISVTGRGALEFLQLQLARDIGYLFPERSLTALMLAEDGRPLDLVVVYKVQGGYIVETAVGRGPGTLAHLQSSAGDDVEVRDLADEKAVIGIEGPYSWEVIGRLFEAQLTGLPYQGVASTEWGSEEMLVSRTGYTAEYGYKLILSPEAAAKAWDQLVEEALPVGHQALEIAMLEMRQPILHRELGQDGTVMRCGLNWLVELDKEEFIGRDALLAQKDAGADSLTVSFVADPSHAFAPDAAVIAGGELEIGRVVHSAYSPGLDKRIGLLRTQAEWTAHGLELQVDDTSGTRASVTTVSSPFLVPLSWTVPIL